MDITLELDKVCNEYSEKLRNLKEEMSYKFKQEFKRVFISVFNKYPKLKSFNWTQYTMGFNDGEPCYFAVYDLYYEEYSDDVHLLKEDNDYYHDYENEENLPDDDHYPELCAIAESLQKVEDLLQEMFGDGVRIVVTREGIEVEGYDHD